MEYRLCVHASEGQRERERRETGRGKRYEGEASERHEEWQVKNESVETTCLLFGSFPETPPHTPHS